jgi:hypothetical protein
MILPFLLAMAATTAHAAPAAAPAAPAKASAPAKLEMPKIEPKTEEGCGVMVAGADAKSPNVYKSVAGLKLLGNTGAITLPKDLGKVRAIRCTRDTIVPGDGDGRPLWEMRLPLVLTDGTRTGVLQIQTKDNAEKKTRAIFYTYGLEKGTTLNDEEQKSVKERLAILDRNLGPVLKAMQQAQAKRAAEKKSAAADAPIAKKQ